MSELEGGDILCSDPVLPVGDRGCCLQYLPGPCVCDPDVHCVAAPIPITPEEEGCREEEEEGVEEEEASLSPYGLWVVLTPGLVEAAERGDAKSPAPLAMPAAAMAQDWA